MKKIYALAILALFLFSIVPVQEAEAKSLNELDKQAKAEYKAIKAKYQTATNAYKSAREEWKTLKGKINQFKESGKGEAAFDKTQTFLLNALDVLDNHNEVLRVWANNIAMDEELRETILSELDYHTDKIADLKVNIENAETVENLIDEAQKVREHYDSHKVAIKRISGILLSARADHIIYRAELLSEKLNTKLDNAGLSESERAEIEALLNDYDDKIELAKEKYEKAREKYSSISSPSNANTLFNEANAFVKEANNYLKEARLSLREAVKAYKKSVGSVPAISTDTEEFKVPEQIRLGGTGKVTAKGDGWAKISGSGYIVLSGSGTVTLNEGLGKPTIEVSGFGEETPLAEGETRYEGTGTITITNGDFVVANFDGTDIEVTAEGTGSMHFYGEGTYCVGNNCGLWPVTMDVEGGSNTAQT